SGEVPVDGVMADGAYYSIERTEAWSRCGVLPVIPPPAHAVILGKAEAGWHDQIVGYIQAKGIHAFATNMATASALPSRRRSRASSAASVRVC
ncbi:hypothetical protein, partial [Paraburkholderia sp. RL17-373-BIF-A]|uniref:hypothetical protein n=1 Tax=Paraburkholderia sp. RL17-373-BIF-A TaxID=3031629 RepID=UPI0038B7F2D8